MTGASGFIRVEVVRRLNAEGVRPRITVRREEAGIDTAVFLVHSIGEGKDWIARERAIAESFRLSAEHAGLACWAGRTDTPSRHSIRSCSRAINGIARDAVDGAAGR